ncbi:MAG: hypothetical protein HRT90_00645 [Candidatus Margulisbacteria bacterium]|nr:hypothetical protein [Candidatus Margulisiibacteriota bacterium]
MTIIIKTPNGHHLDNMILDSFLAFESDHSYIRVYTWAQPTLSLGKSNHTQHLNIPHIQSQNIQLVRRETGGGILPHFHDICFSIIRFSDQKPKAHFENIRQSMIVFLTSLGITQINHSSTKATHTEFCLNTQNQHEINIGHQKCIAIAQKRKKDRYLTHGSIQFTKPSISIPDLFSNIPISMDKTTYLDQHCSFTRKDIIHKLIQFFKDQTPHSTIETDLNYLNHSTYITYKKKVLHLFSIDQPDPTPLV